MTSTSKEPLLLARRYRADAVVQQSLNGNRGKVFSAGRRDTAVEKKFGGAFHTQCLLKCCKEIHAAAAAAAASTVALKINNDNSSISNCCEISSHTVRSELL
jgi:hypothetical protein